MPRRRDEPVRLTRIYTRGGDAGETSLGDGSRVSKLDPLIRSYGAVDELNSLIGWVLVAAPDVRLSRVQNELFVVRPWFFFFFFGVTVAAEHLDRLAI